MLWIFFCLHCIFGLIPAYNDLQVVIYSTFSKIYSNLLTKPISRELYITFFSVWKFIGIRDLTRCRFCIYKIYYQQNSVSTVIVNLEILQDNANRGKIVKKNFFGNRLQNTDFVNFWKNFFNTSHKQVSWYRYIPNCKFQLCVCLVIKSSLFFCKCVKLCLLRTRGNVYKSRHTYVDDKICMYFNASL